MLTNIYVRVETRKRAQNHFCGYILVFLDFSRFPNISWIIWSNDRKDFPSVQLYPIILAYTKDFKTSFYIKFDSENILCYKQQQFTKNFNFDCMKSICYLIT